MSLWETIASKGSHHFPDSFTDLERHVIPFVCLGNELSFQFLHPFAGIKMAHRAAKQIGFRKVKSCYLIRNPKYLFLIEDYAERFIEQRSKRRVNVLYGFLTFEPADKGILELTA